MIHGFIYNWELFQKYVVKYLETIDLVMLEMTSRKFRSKVRRRRFSKKYGHGMHIRPSSNHSCKIKQDCYTLEIKPRHV